MRKLLSHVTILGLAGILLIPAKAYALAWLPLLGLGAAGATATWYFATEILAFIASLIIGGVGWLLWASATLFDALITFTVVQFADTLQLFGMIDGIHTVWAAFRDISNIAIIGMFVFVAITMILNVTEFGTKRFVARVLIIAILINFSLLFTKLIIDTSHVFARQFYNGIVVVATDAYGNPDLNAQELELFTEYGGVAGAFLHKSGLTSLFNTYETLTNIGEKSMAAMLMFAVVVALFMSAFVASFVYGSYLLASRAVLLIFLLLTSSLAFASWLIPRFTEHQYGWRGWWDALIRNALLAPLLITFLWASLTVLQPQETGGSLGAFFENPADTRTWSALVLFIFVAGMLFVSLKLASSFSTSIPGFSATSGWMKWGAGTLGYLAGGLGGMAGQRFIGKPMLRAREKYDGFSGAQLKEGRLWTKPEAGKPKGFERWLARQAQKTLKVGSEGSYNAALAGTALSEKYQKYLQKSKIAFEGKGGALATEKRAMEAAAKKAAPSDVEKLVAQRLQEAAKPGPEDAAIREEETKRTAEKISGERKIEASQALQELKKLNEQRRELKKDLEGIKNQLKAAPMGINPELSNQKKDLDRKLLETTEKTRVAVEVTREALRKSRDSAGIDRVAEKEVTSDVVRRKKEETFAEGLYPGDEGRRQREALLNMGRNQRRRKETRDLLQDTLTDLGVKTPPEGRPPASPQPPQGGPGRTT